MIEIPLTQGKVAIVDDEDLDLVDGYNWVAAYDKGRWYAQAWRNSASNWRMHRLIMQADSSHEIDHINGDGLDNRRENLRFVSRAENTQNAKKRENTSSQYKGVSKSGKRWRAYIRVNGKLYSLGSYKTELEAAMSYDYAAKEHYGEYANTNF